MNRYVYSTPLDLLSSFRNTTDVQYNQVSTIHIDTVKWETKIISFSCTLYMHMHTGPTFPHCGSNLQLLVLSQGTKGSSQKQETNKVEQTNQELQRNGKKDRCHSTRFLYTKLTTVLTDKAHTRVYSQIQFQIDRGNNM